jgi:glyoxylase-like metal-dependent hydrolase (beta-lactamase superfamily II)
VSAAHDAHTFQRRTVGGFAVTVISDGFIDIGVGALRNIEPAEAEARLTAATGSPSIRSSVNTFLVQGGGRTVLIDTGSRDTMGPTMGRLLDNLAAAGVPPGSIDTVVMTHMHPDHAGGLATPDGEAVFPNAELALASAEAGFWFSAETLARAPAAMKPYVQGAQDAAAAYGDRTLTTDNPAPGITRVALPGHTPGHSGYRIDSEGESLLIWGDIMHVPDLQAADPSVCMVYDIDPTAAEASRRRMLDMVSADRLLIAGMHLHFPAFHTIERAGSGYRLVPAP